jgi:glycosyltransferase involved in cell wall biosynthesis
MLLSIVIPVYNEKETLFEIIGRVLASPVPLAREIVLVDDCSKDGSRALYSQLPQRFPDARLRVILHERNRGKGAALRTGYAAATGDIILVQDADLEYDPADYPQLLQPILDGQADVVYGSRYLRRDAHRVPFFWHTLVNQFLTLLSNMFTNLYLTDMETCYKVFKAEVIRSIKLKSDRFGIEPEVTAKVARGGWRVYEVPIRYAGRTYREGKKITWRDGLKAIFCIVRYGLGD